MTPEMFRKLAALGLSHDQMAGVLEIFEEDAEARKSKVRARVQKWRDKSKDVTSRNVTERDVTDRNATARLTRAVDKSSNSEIKDSGKEVSRAPAAPTTKGTRLSKTWEPAFDPFEFGAEINLPTGAVTDQLQRFRDYWLSKPGQAGTKLDWDATLRNWLRKAADDRRNRSPPRNGNGGGDPMMNVIKDAYNEPDEQDQAFGLGGAVRSLSPPRARGH